MKALLYRASVLVSLALIVILAAPAAAAQQAEYDIREVHDLRYFEGRDRQTLDVFAPEGLKKAPVVQFVHGGAWMVGDKNCFGIYRNVERFLARNGAVVVAINYRLSPAVRHPEHVKDVARAFAWVRANAAQYGGDPDNIILCGHSAGGHLVSLLATDETYLNDPALKLTPADRAALRGVISVSGVYVVPGPDEIAKLGEDMMNSLLADAGVRVIWQPTPRVRSSDLLNPFRKVFGDDAEELKKASPQSHVRKGLPPFLVLYAEHDLPLLADQAVHFGAALKEAGNDVELRKMDDCNHNSIVFRITRPGNPTAEAVLAYLKQHGLRQPAPNP
jgi:acetyl esterase/lipase